MPRAFDPRRGRISAALCLVLLAAAPVAAQSSAPSPGVSPEPSPDAFEAAVAELMAPDALAAAAQEVAAADRELLAAIDPDLPVVMAELDAMAAEELADYLASAVPEPETTEASPEPGASEEADASAVPDASSEPALEGRSGMAFLSAVPRRTPDREPRFTQGGSYLSAIGQVLSAVERFVGDTKVDKGSSRDPGSAFTQDRTADIGGFPISVSTRYQVSNARVRDEVTFSIELTERYAIPSRTAGQPPITVTDTGSATVFIDVCPDEDGTAIARAQTHATVEASGNGLAYSVIADADDTATATVNGQAQVASIAHVANMRRHATGDRGVFSTGGEGSADSHLEGSNAWTTDGSGTATSPTAVQVTAADGANEADIRAWALTGGFASAVDDAAIKAAAGVWRSGRCLELKADPPGKEVDPSSETEITVTIHHKAYDDEVERDVRATALEGTEKIEPLDEPIRAPKTFKYTATSEQQGEGTITFKSVSNRGIAEELTETYTVNQRLRLDVDGKYRMPLEVGQADLTYKGRDLRVRVLPGDPPQVSVEGRIQVRGRIVIPLPLGRCTGSYRQDVDVHAGPDRSARLVGDAEERRLAVKLMPPERGRSVRIRGRCPAPGLEVDTTVNGGDFLRTWSTALGEAELPLEGGTVRVGRGRSTGTFTLREEQPRR